MLTRISGFAVSFVGENEKSKINFFISGWVSHRSFVVKKITLYLIFDLVIK